MTSAMSDAFAMTVRCPKCNAQPRFSCRTLTLRPKSLKRPHDERLAAYRQSHNTIAQEN